MTTPKPPRIMQKAKAGRNVVQVGGNYTTHKTINFSLWISIMVVVALGSYVLLDDSAGWLPQMPTTQHSSQ